MKSKSLPRLDYLHECFDIDSRGSLIWKARPSSHFNTFHGSLVFNSRFPGRIAGTSDSYGYRSVSLDRQHYKVHWDAASGVWKSEIQFNKKRYYLGRFRNIDSATEAYRQAATKHFGEFARVQC